jgi:acyl-CoA thioester hydrolase
MNEFSQEVQIRWSDLDPNFHLRHSVYYDWGAFCRIAFLNSHGLTMAVMQKLQFGPILFREECIFRKEIRLGDQVKINLQLVKARRDFSRWTFQHQIFKNDDQLCAVLTVDGAWMNLAERKLMSPPEQVLAVFSSMPASQEIEWS